MILTRLNTIPKSLSAIISRSFGSSGHHHEKPAEEQEIQATKFNPEKTLDLRGHENMAELNEYERSYSPLLSKVYSHFSAYHFFSLFGNKLAKTIGSLASQSSFRVSDSHIAPKIHPNGIPIYDCCSTSSQYLRTNKLATVIVPASILLLSSHLLMSVFSYGLMYYVFYVTHLKLASDLVIKLELIPNTEEIVYQTTNIFGNLATKRAKISDLEATDFDELFGQKNISERATRGLYNKEVAFRIRGSKDLLLFSKNGYWNQEGLNHELIC